MSAPTVQSRRRSQARSRKSSQTKVKTAVYCRISRDAAMEGLGVERQEQACRKYAEAREWEVDESWVLVENDTSATKGRRPKFEALVAAMKSGEVRAVIAYRLDRLVRRLDDAVRFIEVAKEHDVLVATVGGDLDLTTAQGRGQTALLAVVANMEADATSERVLRRNEQARLSGRMAQRGMRPYGWSKDHKRPRPTEARVVKEMCERLAAGDSLSEIARSLNGRGIKTAGDRRWDVRKVREVAGNPRHAGYIFHGREIVYDDAGHPVMAEGVTPIISTSLHDEVVHALENRRVVVDNWTSTRRHLLSGTLTRCGTCGEKLLPHQQTNGKVSYRCRGHLSRDRDQTDRYVLDQVRDYALKVEPRRVEWRVEETVDRTKEITALEDRLADLEDKFVSNGGDPARLARMTQKIEAEIEALQDQRREALQMRAGHRMASHEYGQFDLTKAFEYSASLLPNGDHEDGMTDAQKDEADRLKEQKAKAINAQRYWIRMYVERVVIHPTKVRGRKFDTDSIEIVWRDPDSWYLHGTVLAD